MENWHTLGTFVFVLNNVSREYMKGISPVDTDQNTLVTLVIIVAIGSLSLL